MNPLRRLLPSIALTGLLALGASAWGQVQSFVSKTRTVRAAVLLLDGDKTSANSPLPPLGPGPNPMRYGQTAAPFAFFNLDQTEGVKPTGWTFINPNAPGAVTTEIQERYAELFNSTSDPRLPVVGSPIGKRNGAYWTVSLSKLNETQIASYDLLLIAPRTMLSLNTIERERLRRFVDGGGVLWVDLGATPLIDKPHNVPLAFELATAGAGAFQDVTSPLLNGIRRVTGSDLGILNPGTNAIRPVSLTAYNDLPLVGEFLRYRSVAAASVSGGFLPVIAEAQLGSGAIVVTARGAAMLLNNNQFNYIALTPVPNAGIRAAARLGVNIVGMGGTYSQPGGGSRKSTSASFDPGSPVLSRFTAEGSFGPGNIVSGAPTSSPVTYKGFLIASIGGRIVVFDAKPGRDLDSDGDEDDGLVDAGGAIHDDWRDTSVGRSMDVVWVSPQLPDGPISSPVCAEVPDEVGGVVDQILVANSLGTVFSFQLNQSVNNRLVGGVRNTYFTYLPPNNSQPPQHESDPVTGPIINPPTVHDGLAYVADATDLGNSPTGRVWVIDLANHQVMNSLNPWYVGGPGIAGTPLPGFTTSPTVGYIPIGDNSGGVDRVLYAPGISGSNHQPGFVSLWLGAKGENPSHWEVNGGVLTITTRAGANGQLPIYYPPSSGGTASSARLGVHLTVLDEFGNPLDTGSWVNLLGGPSDGGSPGVINFQTSKTQQDFDTAKIALRIDYSIDWGKDPVNLSSAIERGRLLLPIRKSPSVDQSQRILGPIALSSRGTLHLVEGPNSPTAAGGSYFAIREDAGRGSFRVISRYTLYQSYQQTFGATGLGQGASVPPVLEDNDDVMKLANASMGGGLTAILNQPFTTFRFAGGIALRNGLAYASINASHGPIPVAMLGAFKAEPETPELKLGTNLPTNPVLMQTDFARSNPAAVIQTPTQTRLSGDRLTVDTEQGIIRIENLATVTRNEITDCLSLSQPVGIGGDNRAFTLRTPDREGDRWSPLLWYGLWNGGTATSTPLVAGNEVFLGATSMLPGLFASNFTVFNANSGVIWSVDADTPTTGVYAVPSPTRPWLTQAAQLIGTNPANIQVSPYFRMPQNRGLTSLQDWVLRLNQTKIGTSTTTRGVAGGDGIVAAWGDNGLYGLSRADFVVADEGRLLRVDSSGNPISNAFGGRFTGIGNGGGSADYRPLVRPVKAYPVGDGEFLVVDAGANRVVRLDDDGSELRSIDRITLDPTHKPADYRANDPLVFKDPRDAVTYEGYVYKGASDVVTGQQAVEYWIRYIVADAGNGRIVELADRYAVDAQGRVGNPISVSAPDPETGDPRITPQVGVLVWQSPSLQTTTTVGSYYNSISRVFIGSLGTGRYVYVAGVSKSRPTRISAGLDNPQGGQQPTAASGGAVVIFDPLGGVRVFDRFGLPSLQNTKFLSNPATGVFDITTPASRPRQNDRPFTALAAVSAATYVSGGQAGVRIMVTDADAVYEFQVASTTLGNPNLDPTKNQSDLTLSLTPTWFINEASFTALRPGFAYGKNAKYFRPLYARRLDSGDVLIVNGYSGATRDGSSYSGEVVLLDGLVDFGELKQNLGFGFSSIHFELPPLTGIRGLVSPVFADRR
jgi:hypothetical protein